MSYTFELSPKAEKELYEAWNWYEDEQPDWVRDLKKKSLEK